MARLPRLLIAGLPHLLSQRAQHGQVMVRDDEDRCSLLSLLREGAAQHRVALHAYAIADGRLDLVATPEEAAGLSRLMQAVARRHAAAFNRRHGRAGSLWEGRFRAALIEPASWLLPCMSYVDQLTVASAASENASGPASMWSSRAAHSGFVVDPLLTDPGGYWLLGNTPFEREAAYRRLLERGLTSLQRQQIEGALRGGWVLGNVDLSDKLGDASRSVRPRNRGRPRKSLPS